MPRLASIGQPKGQELHWTQPPSLRQIGPLLAENAEAALGLVEAILRSEQGPWLLDAVHSQGEFLQGLTAAGWTIERPFQRMWFGRSATLAVGPPYAVAGPEFG